MTTFAEYFINESRKSKSEASKNETPKSETPKNEVPKSEMSKNEPSKNEKPNNGISQGENFIPDAFKTGALRNLAFAVVDAGIKTRLKDAIVGTQERSKEFSLPVLNYNTVENHLVSQIRTQIDKAKENLLCNFFMMFGYSAANPESYQTIQRRLTFFNKVADGDTEVSNTWQATFDQFSTDIKKKEEVDKITRERLTHIKKAELGKLAISDDWKKLFFPKMEDADYNALNKAEYKEISTFILNALEDANKLIDVTVRFDSNKKENILFIAKDGKEILKIKADPTNTGMVGTNLRMYDFSRLKLENLPVPIQTHIKKHITPEQYNKQFNELNALNISYAQLSSQFATKEAAIKKELKDYFNFLATATQKINESYAKKEKEKEKKEKKEKKSTKTYELIQKMKTMTANITAAFPDYDLLSVALESVHRKYCMNKMTLSAESIICFTHNISITTTIDRELFITGTCMEEALLVHRKIKPLLLKKLTAYYDANTEVKVGFQIKPPAINVFNLMEIIMGTFETEFNSCNKKRQERNVTLTEEYAKIIAEHNKEGAKVALNLALKIFPPIHIPTPRDIFAPSTWEAVKPKRYLSLDDREDYKEEIQTKSVAKEEKTVEEKKEPEEGDKKRKSNWPFLSSSSTKSEPTFKPQPVAIPPIALGTASNTPRNLSTSSSRSAMPTPPSVGTPKLPTSSSQSAMPTPVNRP